MGVSIQKQFYNLEKVQQSILLKNKTQTFFIITLQLAFITLLIYLR